MGLQDRHFFHFEKPCQNGKAAGRVGRPESHDRPGLTYTGILLAHGGCIKTYRMLTIILLLLAGLACFYLFFGSIEYFEKV